MSNEATNPDLKAQLAAATRDDGILAINPKGDMVRLRPGSVRLAADPERGLYLEGLKDGWHLADSSDVSRAKAAADKAEQDSPRGQPSPKKSGA